MVNFIILCFLLFIPTSCATLEETKKTLGSKEGTLGKIGVTRRSWAVEWVFERNNENGQWRPMARQVFLISASSPRVSRHFRRHPILFSCGWGRRNRLWRRYRLRIPSHPPTPLFARSGTSAPVKMIAHHGSKRPSANGTNTIWPKRLGSSRLIALKRGPFPADSLPL
jgi:hypothetical protein